MRRLHTVSAIAATAALFAAISTAHGQAFENLNFETVVIGAPNSGPFNTPAVDDVPGWTFSHANPPQLYFHVGLTPQQYLSTDLYTDDGGFPLGTPLEGHYTLVMASGDASGICEPCIPTAPWVEQTGLVPANTQQIKLLGDLDPFSHRELPGMSDAATFHVYLDGAEIPLAILPSGELVGDASAFAGTLATLRIELDVDYSAENLFELFIGVDAIQFVVPEPASGALAVVLGAMIAVGRVRRNAG